MFQGILSVCKAAGHAYLLQSSVLATLLNLFQRRKHEHVIQASQLLTQYSLVYKRDSFIDFIPTALELCAVYKADHELTEDLNKCGFTLLLRLLEINLGHPEVLEKHLRAVVSAIWQHVTLPLPTISSSMYKDLYDYDFAARELSVSDHAWICLNMIAISAPPVILIRLIANIINVWIANHWSGDELIGPLLAHVVAMSKQHSYFDIPISHILVAYVEILLPIPLKVPLTKQMKTLEGDLDRLQENISDLVWYLPSRRLSITNTKGVRKMASMTDIDLQEAIEQFKDDKHVALVSRESLESFTDLRQMLKLLSVFTDQRNEGANTMAIKPLLTTLAPADIYGKADLESLLNVLYSFVLSSTACRRMYSKLNLCAEPALFIRQIYLLKTMKRTGHGDIEESDVDMSSLEETLSMVWSSITTIAANTILRDGHATSTILTDLALQMLQYLDSAENTVRRPHKVRKSGRRLSATFRKSSSSLDGEEIGDMVTFVSPLRVYVLHALDVLIVRSFALMQNSFSGVENSTTSIGTNKMANVAAAQTVEQPIISPIVASYLANLFQSDDWPVVAKTAGVFVDLITLRHRGARIEIIETHAAADLDSIVAVGGGATFESNAAISSLSHVMSMSNASEMSDRKSLSKLLGDEAAAVVIHRRLSKADSDDDDDVDSIPPADVDGEEKMVTMTSSSKNIRENGVNGKKMSWQIVEKEDVRGDIAKKLQLAESMEANFIGGEDSCENPGTVRGVVTLAGNEAVLSTIGVANNKKCISTSNPWFPFTEDAAVVVRDAIFNKLCSCANDAARQTVAAWEVQFQFLAVAGIEEVLASVPMILTLEEFWRLYPFEHSRDQEFVKHSVEMLACQRLFFVAYFLTIGKLFNCPALESFMKDVIACWTELRVLPTTLLFDVNNLVFAVQPSSEFFTGIKVATWSKFSNRDMMKDTREEKTAAGCGRPSQVQQLESEPEPLGVPIQLPTMPPEVDRAALLQIMLASESFSVQSEATRLRDAFSVRYQPQPDPFERTKERASAASGDSAAREGLSIACASTSVDGLNGVTNSPIRSSRGALTPSRKSPMKARLNKEISKKSIVTVTPTKVESIKNTANAELYSPVSLGTPTSRMVSTRQALGPQAGSVANSPTPLSGARTPLWKEKYQVAKEGGLVLQEKVPEKSPAEIVIDQLNNLSRSMSLTTPSKVARVSKAKFSVNKWVCTHITIPSV
jgi:hypothetical protein